MQSLLILQEGVDTNLNWLFVSLLGFMAVVVIVGAIVGWERGEADRRLKPRAKKAVNKARTATKPPSNSKAKRSGPRRKSN